MVRRQKGRLEPSRKEGGMLMSGNMQSPDVALRCGQARSIRMDTHCSKPLVAWAAPEDVIPKRTGDNE